MKPRSIWIFATIAVLASFQLGMSRHGEYDEQERLEQKLANDDHGLKNPATGIAAGVKEATYDSTKGLLSDTRDGARQGAVTGTLEGITQGSGKVLDSAVKGAVKVASLGQADLKSYEVTQPESNAVNTTLYSPSSVDKSDSDMTKITIKIPGT